MKTIACPECKRKVRPCNLRRHEDTHMPKPIHRAWGTQFLQPRRPIMQSRHHDRRYDEIVPRGYGRYRFRIYRLRGGELQLLGAAETAGGFGQALYEMNREGEFIADDCTGVLDTACDPADWICHPFALGRTREEAA
jgi:hypothetical protein